MVPTLNSCASDRRTSYESQETDCLRQKLSNFTSVRSKSPFGILMRAFEKKHHDQIAKLFIIVDF